MAVTLDMARQYLGIDVDDDPMINANLSRALTTAQQLVRSGVGENVESVFPGDPRVDELILAYTADLFNGRSASAKAENAIARHIDTLEWQLRLEYRRRGGA